MEGKPAGSSGCDGYSGAQSLKQWIPDGSLLSFHSLCEDRYSVNDNVA